MGVLVFWLLCLGVPARKLPVLTVSPVLRCTAEREELSQPAHIAIDDKGHVFALDRGNRKIYAWDPRGKLKGTFGGQGSGPGEISMEDGVGCLALTRNHILVFDTRSQKVHRWTRDHVYVDSRPLPASLGRVRDAAGYGDQIVVYTSLASPVQQRLVLVSGDLEQVRVLAEVNDSEYRRTDEGGWLYRPFADRLVYAFGKEKIWFGQTNQNWVMPVSPGKETLGGKQVFPLVGEPVTEADKAQYLENHRKYASDKDRIEFAKDHPVMTMLFSLGPHRLAATQFNYAGESFKGLLMDTEKGKVIGAFESPIGASLLYLGSMQDQFIYAAEDEQGQCQVVLAAFKANEGASRGKPVLD